MNCCKVRIRGQVTGILLGTFLGLLLYLDPTTPPKQIAKIATTSQIHVTATDDDLAKVVPPKRNRSPLGRLTLAEQEAHCHTDTTPKKTPTPASGFSSALQFINNMMGNQAEGLSFRGSLKNTAKQFKDGLSEVFYTFNPPSVGVPETLHRTKPQDLLQEFEPGSPAPLSAPRNFTLPMCGCVRHIPALKASGHVTIRRWWNGRKLWTRRLEMISNCNDYATSRGPGQKVVSYTYYGDTKDPMIYHRYFSEIPNRAAEVMDKYPGWIMRVYHNVSDLDLEGQKLLCDVFCSYPHLDFCHVDRLPPPFEEFGSQQKVGTLWRFLVGLDPLVDVFISRDLDSYILPREQAAVKQWLGTEYPYHIMRDHPYHKAHILAGLWGCRINMKRANAYHLLSTVLSQSRDDQWGYDQKLLRQIVWPATQGKMLGHDSYSCCNVSIQVKGATLPFPVQRDGLKYTGYGRTKEGPLKNVKPCPVPCRPKEHRDWLYC
ncbi:uncharacterized protein LOC143028182 [Oratosquilla oratoria]|uniref:uncharacterized protein LOC143028182 n=1 Tax=Oratosquilla oratoria TaxID=337810 RepID=UPI003F763961